MQQTVAQQRVKEYQTRIMQLEAKLDVINRSFETLEAIVSDLEQMADMSHDESSGPLVEQFEELSDESRRQIQKLVSYMEMQRHSLNWKKGIAEEKLEEYRWQVRMECLEC